MEDARLMLKDGTFGAFLQRWSDKFPYKSPLAKIKEYKELHGCTLQEARDRFIRDPKVEVDFQIGDDYILRKRDLRFSLLVRIDGIWTMAPKDFSLEMMTETWNDFFPVFRRTVRPICSREEVLAAGRKGHLEALARKLARRIRSGKERFSRFCKDEIWRTNGSSSIILWSNEDRDSPFLHIDSACGTTDIPFTTEGITQHLADYFSRIDLTRGAFSEN